MKIRQLFCAVALGMMSFAAQATVYTYTGNTFDFDSINTTPSHITAQFDFDFENSPLASAGMYSFRSWDIQAGTIHLSSANDDTMLGFFSFDAAMNISGWYFSGTDIVTDDSIQSLSANYSFFSPNQASDIALAQNPLRAASVYDNQGSWTVSAAADVPEPASMLLLGIGAAACAGATRRKRMAA